MPTTIDGTSGITAVGGTFSGTVDATTLTEGAVAVPRMVLATAQNTTSGTAIDFTGIPSWVKRITVMMSGVSTSGTNFYLLQIGAGSVDTSGYRGAVAYLPNASAIQGINLSSGLQLIGNNTAASLVSGQIVLTLLGSNTWSFFSSCAFEGGVAVQIATGAKTLGGTLDRLRITTSGGTDTFDAGSVNIMYEG